MAVTRIMAAMTLKSKKKASRVADEELAAAGAAGSPPSRWASLFCAMVVAPFSLFSCLSNPNINGPDGVWASAEMPPTSSELTHLMVRDSLRYAILM